MTIKVENQRGSWVLDESSIREGLSDTAKQNFDARGWLGLGLVRRENGKKQYVALVSKAKDFASIIC